MKVSLASLLALLALLFVHSCNNEPPIAPAPEPERTLTLSVADSSLHEIWLRLSLPDSLSGRTVKIYRNDTLRFAFELSRRDTVVMDSGLALGTPYAYCAVRLENTRALDSATLAAATMPTTSHALLWRVDTLGTTATWLNDVCVINDTCIWVVGQINGSSYNAARFDGQQWHFYSFQFPLYNGDGTVAGYYNGECTAVFGLSPTSILFSDGGGLMVWNGAQARYLFQPLAVSKIWASSENDIYVVGGNGFIAHYNGTAWRRVQSGTTTVINDIWGSIDKATGDTLVLCRAIFNTAPAGRLLRLNKHHAPTFFTEYPSGFYSLWFRNQANLFGSGTHLYWRRIERQWITFFSVGDFKRAARGTAENDIYFVGDFGTVIHFDGYSMFNFQISLPNWRYAAVSCKGRTVCAVGWRNGAGFALIGRRQ